MLWKPHLSGNHGNHLTYTMHANNSITVGTVNCCHSDNSILDVITTLVCLLLSSIGSVSSFVSQYVCLLPIFIHVLCWVHEN